VLIGKNFLVGEKQKKKENEKRGYPGNQRGGGRAEAGKNYRTVGSGYKRE